MSALAKAIAAWGSEMPAWVRTLAVECQGASVRKVAEKLELSPASISLALNNKLGSLEFVQNRVEQHLMSIQFGCPILGVISVNRCLQEQARPFSSANPIRVQLFRACRSGCPHYKEKQL